MMSSQSMEALLETPVQSLTLLSWRCLLAMCEEALTFEGFVPPDRGGKYFPMPLAFVELSSQLTGAMHKTAEYLFRHNWGFHEYSRKLRITVDEIMYGRIAADGSRMDTGTGLSERVVRSALKALVKMGVLVCEIIRGRFGPEKAYGIHIKDEEEEQTQENEEHRQKVQGLTSEQSPFFASKAPAKSAAPSGKICTPNQQKVQPPPAKSAATIGERKEERNSSKDTSKNRKDSDAQQKELSQHALSFPPLSSRISLDEFRTMAWTPETVLVGLSHAGIAVPDIEAIKASRDESLLAWYDRMCLQPACWIVAEMQKQQEYPEQAWRRIIYRHARGMVDPSSPTWFVKGRSQQSPVLPWHMVGGNKATGELTGKQWKDVEQEMRKGGDWQPGSFLRYDGPDYVSGYAGEISSQVEEVADPEVIEVVAEVVGVRITQKLEPDPPVPVFPPIAEEETISPAVARFRQMREAGLARRTAFELPKVTQTVAPPLDPLPAPYQTQRLRGMTREEITELADVIETQYPMMMMHTKDLEDGSYILTIYYGPGQEFSIYKPDGWYHPASCNERRTALAIAYGNKQASLEEGA